MERPRPCPVCGNWRWREGERPDAEGHHPDCGVNLWRRRQTLAKQQVWTERQRRPGAGR